jgi:hypothetical protein
MTRQDIENRMLQNILSATEGMTIGKRTAARIVGGEKRLERLHIEGKIMCAGKGKGQSGKWRFDLSSVLLHSRNIPLQKSNI